MNEIAGVMMTNSQNKDLRTQSSDSALLDNHSHSSRAPLTGAHEHYESNAFHINIAVNPLVATAAPLLSLATQLQAQTQAPENYAALHQSLCHEVKVLENRAHALGFRSQAILGTRYLLCALIDEIILTSIWGENSAWQTDNLLNTFQRETWGGERFFLILERSAEEPSQYIDLLELGYICLSLGFQGKYRDSKKLNELALFIDNLYDLIRHQRGESSKHLLIADSTERTAKIWNWRLPPIWLTALATLLISGAIYFSYNQQLNHIVNPVNQTVQNLLQTDHNNG